MRAGPQTCRVQRRHAGTPVDPPDPSLALPRRTGEPVAPRALEAPVRSRPPDQVLSVRAWAVARPGPAAPIAAPSVCSRCPEWPRRFLPSGRDAPARVRLAPTLQVGRTLPCGRPPLRAAEMVA